VPKKTVMSVGKEQSALTFELCLQKFGAKRAFDTLVKRKLDPKLLKFWLGYIASAPKKYGKRKENKRRADQLARSARSLANKIEHAAEAPPVFCMGTPTELLAMRALEQMLPEPLRKYAACWENVTSWENRVSRQRPRGVQSPRTERIAALLEIVKECTGSYHYPEVAALLNVMDMAFGRSRHGLDWNERKLAQLQYRARKRMAKVLKD
jgi:hypothetical protein